VRTESADPDSLLNWYRRLIALRRSKAALRSGRTVMLDRTNPSVLTYARVASDGQAILVSLNMSPKTQTFAPGLAAAGIRGSRLRTLLSSPGQLPDAAAAAPITLQAYAAWVAELR
jgi:alpha-glucosidase